MIKVPVAGGAGHVRQHPRKPLAASGFGPVIYGNPANAHKHVRSGSFAQAGISEMGDLKEDTVRTALPGHHKHAGQTQI